MIELSAYLEKLDRAIDPEHAAYSVELMRKAVSWEPVERLPMCVNFPAADWRTYLYSEVFRDREKMLLNELYGAWMGALVRDHRAYTIRANYGVGIIPSLFGCRVMQHYDQMPWIEPLSDTQLRRAVDRGIPPLDSAYGGQVLETERFYLDMLSRYENLSKHVHVYVCDTQGPFDIAHLIMGHRIYTEIYDDPSLVHELFDLASDTYIAFTRLQKELIGETGGYSFHAAILFKGAVRLCDDSATNISREAYAEFCRPCNEKVLRALGGGWIHYCGKGHQILPEILETEGVAGINFGNPEDQDFGDVYRQAAERKIAVLLWQMEIPQQIAKTGVTLNRNASSLEEARALLAAEPAHSDPPTVEPGGHRASI